MCLLGVKAFSASVLLLHFLDSSPPSTTMENEIEVGECSKIK